MNNQHDFQLRNDPARPAPEKITDCEGEQRVLFAGLSCLAGQLDLFETDGDPEGESSDD